MPGGQKPGWRYEAGGGPALQSQPRAGAQDSCTTRAGGVTPSGEAEAAEELETASLPALAPLQNADPELG